MLKALKYEVKKFLIKNDLDIPDYVEQLYQELRKDESIRISAIEKRMIIDKLQHLFSIE